MSSERPRLIYGSYYHGQEAVMGSINDENNIQYHRTETSAHITNALPSNSFGSRQIQAFSNSSVRRGIGHNDYQCVLGPSSESNTHNYHGYGSLVRNAPTPLPEFLHHGANNNNDLHGVSGASSESDRLNYSGYGRQPSDSFEFRSRGDIGAGHNNNYRCVPGPSSEYTRNYPGYGRQPHSFEFRRDGDISASHNNDNHCAPGPSSEYTPNYHGNGRQPLHSLEFSRYGDIGSSHNNYYHLVPRPSYESNTPKNGNGSLVSCTQLSDNYRAGDADSTLNNERSKLIARIKIVYGNLVPLLFSKHSALFDKQDWVKVSSVLSEGLKIYQAEMTCPICFGKVTPQNREVEPGRLPKWDTFPVKRHVLLIHKRKDVVTEETISSVQSVEKKENIELFKEKTYEEKLSVDSSEESYKESSEESSEESPDESHEESSEESSDEKPPEKPADKKALMEPTKEKPTEKKPSKEKPSKKKSNESSEESFNESSEEKPPEIPSDKKSVMKKPTEEKPTKKKPSKKKSSESNPIEIKPSESKPSEKKPSEKKPSEKKSSGKTSEKKPSKKKEKVELLNGSSSDFPSLSSDGSESSSEPGIDIKKRGKIEQKLSSGKRRKMQKPLSSSEESDSPDIKKPVDIKRKQSKTRRKIQKPLSSSEQIPEIPDWKKPGVTFGWVKLTAMSRFQPAFIYPKKDKEETPRAKYLQGKGTLSAVTHPIAFIANPSEVEQAKKSKKSHTYLNAIKKFNAVNSTDF